jgi:D-proline reductase (dithiol) PrdB
MPRLDQLSETSRNALLTLPIPVHDEAPFTPLPQPLADCTLAVVTTAGLHLRTDQPFAAGDPSYRAIPAAAPANDILQSHTSIGFDRVPTQRDLNIVYPVDRLRELVARGELGSIASTCYSFMGAQRDWTRIAEQTAPAVAQRLQADGVDVVLLTPT